VKYPDDFYNKIICADNMDIMKQMPDECLDLVITSPPYNLSIRKTFGNTENWKGKWNNSKLQSVGYDKHNDYMPEVDYIKWQKEVLAECFRLIKDDGAIFYNHKWRVQKGIFQMRPEIIEGLPVRQIIIWHKAGGINFSRNFFLPTYEVIYLIAKSKFKLPPKVNAYGDVWKINQVKGSWHPAPFPMELVEKCIDATMGTVIMDPFVGSGTVPKVCLKKDKTYIGIDISESYCEKVEEELRSFDF